MKDIVVSYRLNEAGRRASLRSGGDGREEQRIVVPPEHPLYDAVLGVAEIDVEGHVSASLMYDGRGSWLGFANPLTVDVVAQRVLEEAARHERQKEEEKAKKEEREEQRARREAEEAENETARRAHLRWVILESGVGELLARSPEDNREWRVRYDGDRWSDDPEVLAKLKAARQEAARQNAALTARQEQAAQERADWIAAHGSDHLRRLTTEQIECSAIYRDERLMQERPGWIWWPDEWSYDAPRNPPAEALVLLDEARKADREAELQYAIAPVFPEEDYDEEHNLWRGYVARALFLERDIAFGGPGHEHEVVR